MMLQIPDGGLALESSPKSAAALPQQAFAITLSDKAIEDMIECVQQNQGIELSMGDAPSFLFGDQEYQIPKPPSETTYDLYFADSTSPKTITRLPNPSMSILRQPKARAAMAKTGAQGEKAVPKPKPKPAKPRAPAAKSASSKKEFDDADADIEALQFHMSQAEAEKQENSARVIDGPLAIKNGKVKTGKTKLLSAQANAPTRSLPTSPALSGIGSPSLGPVGASGQHAQERAKQRFPIIHELAVKDRSYEELLSEWDEGSKQEFEAALEKVATFDDQLQKWVLNSLYWRELDVFEYDYKSEKDRQTAIDNAIRQYDRRRLQVTDPLWQRLLPKEKRGQDIYLSKVQAAIVKGPSQAPAPKISVNKTDGSSANASGDSGKDESTPAKKAKGGEPMSRSNSQSLPGKAKKSDGQSQAKRILSNNKKAAPTKPSPKASPTKPAAKAPTKNPKIKSKEFVTDSDSESDEAPLSASIQKARPKPAAPKPAVEKPAPEKSAPEKSASEKSVAEKPAAKSQAAERPTSRSSDVKAKPASKPAPKVKDSIKAQAPIKTARPQQKRPREEEDSSSSSSDRPLNKRFKPKELPAKIADSAAKHRASDASQNSRGTSSGASLNNKSRNNTSPMKSSPLASSPPTNASDLDTTDERDSIVARKRKVDGPFDSNAKRQRLSPTILQKAHNFRKFYASYEALHKEIVSLEHPPEDKVTDLLDMRERLRVLKNEIYKEAPRAD